MNKRISRTLKRLIASIIVLSFTIIPAAAQNTVAKDVPHIDSGNTAWMIVATALVMFMTIPGLAFFYGGLVRRKNVLNILMQCFLMMALISLEWVMVGYSMTFGTASGFLSPFIGDLKWSFLHGIGMNDLSPYFVAQSNNRIPHLLFVMYQCMFAVITPALIIGAFAERINFKGFVIFSLLWSLLVYNPVAHWIWSSSGWLFKMGTIDFAGGIVVHINAGIAALITAVMLGKRKDYRGHAIPPHNIPFVVMGAAFLWFGWYGFNAGSALAADGLSVSAFLVTHIAAAAAAVTWVCIDLCVDKKPTLVGICTGAVAGLAAVTPAAGYVDISGAIVIGITVSIVCFYMVAFVKERLGYDDSLDAFGVHGMGGIIGSILTGVLATPVIQSAYSGLLFGNTHQFRVQLIAVGTTVLYSGVMTIVIFKLVEKTVGIRASRQAESVGLDETLHNEVAYTSID
ncbi:MAG: ammonium transporter [Bacteroidota bacterium]|nr:ammonium transporter [Bacteroidota bacterium]